MQFRFLSLILFSLPLLLSQTVYVSSSSDLQTAITNATPGATLVVAPGTYVAHTTVANPFQSIFTIDKALTIRADGAGVVLEVPAGQFTGVIVTAGNVTLEGFTVRGGYWGVYAGDPSGAQQLSGLTLRNLTVDTVPAASNPGHGIFVRKFLNTLIEGCTVVKAYVNGILLTEGSHGAVIRGSKVLATFTQDSALKVQESNSVRVQANQVTTYASMAHGIFFAGSSNGVILLNDVIHAHANGIFLDLNSNSNLLFGNLVRQTASQHSIAVKRGQFNTIAGNTVQGSAFHAIILVGSSQNVIERNYLSGFRYDGITLTEENASLRSRHNLIAGNTIVSSGLARGETDGTGIWLNAGSDHTHVYANFATGAVENGLAIFNSSRNYIQSNTLVGNGQGGVFLFNSTQNGAGTGLPTGNWVHSNYLADYLSNAGVNARIANQTEIAYNFISGTGTPDRITTGIGLQNSTGNAIFQNTLLNLKNPLYFFPDVTSTTYFGNRHVNTLYKYVFPPGNTRFDAGVNVGGNYWSDHQPGAGQPSRSKPYTDFVYEANGNRGGPFVDRYPYAQATLRGAPGFAFRESAAGPFAAGSNKLIRWYSRGCSWVRLAVRSASTGEVEIANGIPEIGQYMWTVPSELPQGTYTLIGQCWPIDGSAAAATQELANALEIAGGDLTLVSPSSGQPLVSGGSTRVAWRRSPAVSSVSVYLRAGGTEYPLASNIQDEWAQVTLPALVSSDARIVIRGAGAANAADSADVPSVIRGNTGQTLVLAPRTFVPGASSQVFSDAVNGRLFIGETAWLRWISPTGSAHVDLGFFDTGSGSVRSIATGLPDVGQYAWNVPEFWMRSGYLQVTFRDANGNALSTQIGPSIDITYLKAARASGYESGYSTALAEAVTRYRLYNPNTRAHLHTIDANEYTFLSQSGFQGEGTSGRILDGIGSIDGVSAVPFYRLYNRQSGRHLWTRDRNEFLTLREFTSNWTVDPVREYVFPSQVTNSIPLYRLRNCCENPPVHHWTTDLNEYNALGAGPDWIQEGIAGHILRSTGTVNVQP